jgi:hypothetical protein
MESFLRPCVATGVSPLAVSCLSGVTPRSQPWTTAVTLPHGRDGLGARWMAVLWTFCQPSLCRHVRRELLRTAWLNFTSVIPATACYQRNYVETYSRFKKTVKIIRRLNRGTRPSCIWGASKHPCVTKDIIAAISAR